MSGSTDDREQDAGDEREFDLDSNEGDTLDEHGEEVNEDGDGSPDKEPSLGWANSGPQLHLHTQVDGREQEA